MLLFSVILSPAEFDQLAAPQDPQLVGDGGLGQSQQISDVAHAQLGPEQGVEDLDPGGLGGNETMTHQKF